VRPCNGRVGVGADGQRQPSRHRSRRTRSIALRDGGSADGIDWLDENHLILTLMGHGDVVSQFWILSYPDGTWWRLTNDLSNYASFGLSADRQTLVAGRWDYQVGISVLEGSTGEPAQLVAPTPFVGAYLGWRNDTLLYATLSPANNRPAVWALARGDTNPEEVVENATSPEGTPDGRAMIFIREENGRRSIWRADADGRNGAAIGTSASTRVTLTPGGKHVIYISSESGTQSMWMRPIDGGPARQLANVFAYYPAASPDGRSVAFVSGQRQESGGDSGLFFSGMLGAANVCGGA
jgi:hypothetical protein